MASNGSSRRLEWPQWMAEVLTAMEGGNVGVVWNIRRPYTATISYIHVGQSTNDTKRNRSPFRTTLMLGPFLLGLCHMCFFVAIYLSDSNCSNSRDEAKFTPANNKTPSRRASVKPDLSFRTASDRNTLSECRARASNRAHITKRARALRSGTYLPFAAAMKPPIV